MTKTKVGRKSYFSLWFQKARVHRVAGKYWPGGRNGGKRRMKESKRERERGEGGWISL